MFNLDNGRFPFWKYLRSPAECYLQRKTKIEPDLRLDLKLY